MIEWVALDELDLNNRMNALNVKGHLNYESHYFINSINGQFYEWIKELDAIYFKHGSKKESYRIWYNANEQLMKLQGIKGNGSTTVKIIEKFMPPQLLEVYNELKKVKTINKSIE